MAYCSPWLPRTAATAMFGMAVALAIGIGIRERVPGAQQWRCPCCRGMSARKAFALGALSGLAEPVFGIPVVLFAGLISPYMPWMLAFSAGAMMYAVVEELIPEAHLGEHLNAGTLGDGRLPGHDDLDVALG
ncbi:MAG: ZIP family metal transporter [Adlercreutzia equolifaciens]